MRKMVLVFLFVCLCFASCDAFGSGSESGVSSEDATGADERQTEIDKSVVRVLIERKIDNVNFFLEDANGLQTLTAICYDKDGNEVKDATVVWEWRLTSDADYSVDGRVFAFDVNSLDEQGDYQVRAVCPGSGSSRLGLSATYDFSLLSENKLRNSLSYSFASPAPGGLELDDDGRVKFTSLYEYDGNLNYISDRGDRFVLNNSLSYYVTGENLLYIVPKEGARLGKITLSADAGDGDWQEVPVLYTDEGGFLIGATYDKDYEEDTYYLEFSCGSKDSREIRLDLNMPKETLAAPVISAAAAPGDGMLVTITADKVSNSARPVPGGNMLHYEVYRTPLVDNGEGRRFFFDDLSDHYELSRAVVGGAEVHLPYDGEYEIRAWISNGAGKISRTENASVTVAAIELPEGLLSVQMLDLETYEWPASSGAVPAGGFFDPAALPGARHVAKASLDLSQGPSYLLLGTLRCELLYTSPDGESHYRETRVTADDGVPYSLYIMESGMYEYKAWVSGVGGGRGLPYPGDNKDPYLSVSMEILPPVQDVLLETTVTSAWSGSRLRAECVLSSRDIPDGVLVRYAIYNEGFLFRSGLMHGGSGDVVFDVSSLTDYRIYAYNAKPGERLPYSRVYEVPFAGYGGIASPVMSRFLQSCDRLPGEQPYVGEEGTDNYYRVDTVAFRFSFPSPVTTNGYMWCKYVVERKTGDRYDDWMKVYEQDLEQGAMLQVNYGVKNLEDGIYRIRIYCKASENADYSDSMSYTYTQMLLRKPKLTAAPAVDASDAVQDEPDVRKVRITNVRDASGRFCRLAVAVDGSPNNLISADNLRDASGNWIEEGVFALRRLGDGKEGVQSKIEVTAYPMPDTWQSYDSAVPAKGRALFSLERLSSVKAFLTGYYYYNEASLVNKLTGGLFGRGSSSSAGITWYLRSDNPGADIRCQIVRVDKHWEVTGFGNAGYVDPVKSEDYGTRFVVDETIRAAAGVRYDYSRECGGTYRIIAWAVKPGYITSDRYTWAETKDSWTSDWARGAYEGSASGKSLDACPF